MGQLTLRFRILTVALLTVMGVGSAAAETVLVTGSNRGLGLEFTKQYAERGYKVIATARKPKKADALQALAAENPNIIIEKLDVTDLDAIDALAEKYEGEPIDILINNAGITGDPFETQILGKIDYDVFDTVMRVNVMGPLKIAEAFLDNVAASEQKKIISVSSSMGSIAKTFGTGYFYRSSKAALNMSMATLAKEVKSKGIAIGLVNPGPTATDMMKQFDNGGLRDPALATADMIRNIDTVTIDNSGIFLQYDGTVLPW